MRLFSRFSGGGSFGLSKAPPPGFVRALPVLEPLEFHSSAEARKVVIVRHRLENVGSKILSHKSFRPRLCSAVIFRQMGAVVGIKRVARSGMSPVGYLDDSLYPEIGHIRHHPA